MTEAQKLALEKVLGRGLTAAEITAVGPYLQDPNNRDDIKIAKELSVGRMRLQHKPIGHGTILEIFGEQGGAFIDALETMASQDRNVYWGMKPLERGEFDLGIKGSQDKLTLFAQSMPTFADNIRALQALGYAPDPVDYNQISDVLNVAEGRMTL